MINQTLEELNVQSQYRLIEKLRESEARYRSVFTHAPIGLWEQDWSLVKQAINELQIIPGRDLDTYLRRSPQEIWRLAGLIQNKEVNAMVLSLVGASSEHQQPSLLNTYLTETTLGLFVDIFVALACGKTTYQTECQLVKLDGSKAYHYVSLIVLPGHERHLDSIIVTISDMTSRKQYEMALQKSEEFLRMSQLAGGIGTWEANLLTGQQIWSDSVMSNLGFKHHEDPSWEDFLAHVHPDDRQIVIDAAQAHLEQNIKFSVEYRIINKYNDIRWMCSTGLAERDDLGRPIYFRGVVQDITERKLVEEKLHLSERIFESTHEGIMVTDALGHIVEVNDAFCRITGFSREEVLGKLPNVLQSDHQDSVFYAEIWKCLHQYGHWSGEIWNRRKDGEIYAELISISVILDPQGHPTHYVGNLSDITVLKQHEKQLEHIAHYDALTGIPNRVLLVDRMQQAQAQTRRDGQMLAICYLDLDGFKPINDHLGHEAGDSVLIEVAKRMVQSLRGGDTVARLGGDEFVILLLGIADINECKSSLDRLLQVIAAPILLADQTYQVTASVGVTLYPHDEEDPDTLLRHADQAMYLAKRLGKNRYYFFDASQEQQIKFQRDQLLRIEQGLINQEFELFYQPKVALSTYKVVGVEALIRWRHPEQGVLSPDHFLPHIENTLLEIELGEWVIETALLQIENWLEEDLSLPVSVNISVSHLQSSHFAEKLHRQLAMHPKVSAHYLQIEILETAALVDITKVAGIIEECGEFGVSFALDDFGTGYSSLAYLRRLPAETLKIDLSFVRDMLVNSDDRAIVKGVISLGHSFNRITVAEGVETDEHFKLLREMGCDIGQGFGIARPMPAKDIMGWCKEYAGKTSHLNHSVLQLQWPKEIQWGSEFEIDHERIDSEHKIFLGLIIEMNKEINGGCELQRIKRLLNEVTEYAKFHFVSEENIMEEIAYPELEAHRILHRRLLSKLSDIAYDLSQQQIDYFSLVEFLFEWFANHTAIEDKKIALYNNQH
jgi:diguanylate cyclase (GGDEF)-like protein/hemerythrin-like metal-binding protein/PAS domain S-box-containing protein